MLQAGNGWLIATLGEGQEKKEGGREEGERARLAATFQRVIIAIRLGGLDSVVPSRARERKK